MSKNVLAIIVFTALILSSCVERGKPLKKKENSKETPNATASKAEGRSLYLFKWA